MDPLQLDQMSSSSAGAPRTLTLATLLLTGAIGGIASILTWQLLAARVGEVYGAADAGVQGMSACTPNPGGGGCP